MMKLKKGLAIALAALAVIALGSVAIEIVYAEQLPPGITIDGKSFSGQNRLAVQASLSTLFKQYDEQGVTLVLDKTKQTIHFSQAGLKANLDKTVETAFDLSRGSVVGLGTWHAIASVVERKNNVPLYIDVDPTVRDKFLDEVMHTAFGARPQDASLSVTDSSIDITPEQAGIVIQDDELTNRLVQAFQNHASFVIVPSAIQKADVTAADLAQAKQEAAAIVARDVTLTAGSKQLKPTRSDLGNWLLIQSEADGYHARLDPLKVRSYLNDVVSPAVSLKPSTEETDKNGNVIKAGTDGSTLNLDDSVTAVIDGFAKSDQKLTVKLAVQVKNKSTVIVDPQLGCDPNKAPGKYIEINLTMQKMCLYEGGTFVNTFRVSTGKWSTPTPEGTFAVQNKIAVAYSARYGLYMPYWKAITPDGEYGIHGLPYKGNWVEGQGHIGTPVSHGCIRLGPGDDVYVHNWADLGIPVYIHK